MTPPSRAHGFNGTQEEVKALRVGQEELKKKAREAVTAKSSLEAQHNVTKDEVYKLKRELERQKKVLAGKERDLEQV